MIFNSGKKFFIAVLALSLVVTSSFIFIPEKKVEASAGACASAFDSTIAEVIGEDIATAPEAVPVYVGGKTLAEATTAGDSQKNFIQDCIEHEVALGMAKTILTSMTNEMVKWIDSGFKGNPTFVTNPGQFLGNVADQVAGQFILGSDSLAFLCSPFQLQLKIALALNYSYSSNFAQTSACTLSQVAGNIDAFFKDPFTPDSNINKGWAGWFSMTQNPANNGIGAFLQASAQLDSQIASQQHQGEVQANWGNGFLSMTECEDASGKKFVKYGDASEVGTVSDGYNTKSDVNYSTQQYGDQNCTVKTPGSVIENQLTSQLGEPVAQLGLADDIDKVLNALTNQLFQKIFSSAGGLLGATQKGAGGKSRLDELVSQADTSSKAIHDKANKDLNKSLNGKNTKATAPAAPEPNVAINQLVQGSCPVADRSPTKAVDGSPDNSTGSSYAGSIVRNESACGAGTKNAWIQVDLRKPTNINEIRIYQRIGAGSASTNNLQFHIEIVDQNGAITWQSPAQIQDFSTNPYIFIQKDGTIPKGVTGNIVRIQADGPGRLEIAEIEVYPNLPPTLTILGVSPMTIQPGVRFVDPGVAAQDTEDGDLTSKVVKSGSVPAGSPVGEYILTYTVTDSGGATVSASRVVRVQSLVFGN